MGLQVAPSLSVGSEVLRKRALNSRPNEMKERPHVAWYNSTQLLKLIPTLNIVCGKLAHFMQLVQLELADKPIGQGQLYTILDTEPQAVTMN